MSKKLNKVLLVASAMFLLAGCDIEAKPSYGDKDFLVGGTAPDGSKIEDIKNNLRTLVYDELYENGSINSAVLNEVINYIAEDKIKSYDELKASSNENDKKLVVEIKGRMNEKLYAAVSTGSYDYRNKFDEEKFVKTIQQNLTYKIELAEGNTTYSNDYVFLKDSDKHLYKGGADRDGVEYTEDKREPNLNKYVLNCDYTRYMEDTYLQEVYRELLIEKYVKDEELDSFGKSAARKISYVSIAENDNHPEAASSLVKTFVNEYITVEGKTVDLALLENAWKGIDLTPEAEALLEHADIKTDDHDHTLYGDILTRYNKINDNELLTDESAESEFTNSGSYSKETGLELKKNELRKNELSNDGWFAKSNDTLNLPSSITNRLFDINVANDLKNNLKKPAEFGSSKFVTKINDTYYLKSGSINSADEVNMDCVIYDSSSKTYYIVIVEEAVSPRKLGDSKESTLYTDEMYEEAIYEIAQKYASRETYKNKALVHYLEEANIEFHDTAVYEYFKSTYPDVWDDED